MKRARWATKAAIASCRQPDSHGRNHDGRVTVYSNVLVVLVHGGESKTPGQLDERGFANHRLLVSGYQDKFVIQQAIKNSRVTIDLGIGPLLRNGDQLLFGRVVVLKS